MRARAQVRHVLLLIRVGLRDWNQGACLALHFLQRDRLSELLQLVLGLLLALALALLVHFFTGPEETSHILAGGFDHGVSLEHFELAEQFVREQGTEVCKRQVHCLRVLVDSGNGRSQAAACLRMRVAHVAHVNLAFAVVTASLRDRSVVRHELRLVDVLRLARAATEKRRDASSLVLLIAETTK